MSEARTKSRWAELLDFVVSPESNRPLFEQVHQYLQHAITSGRVPPGSRLPSTRRLADQLRVSRTSTYSAYEKLAAEGYIETIVGSGTFVTNDLPRIENAPAHAAPRLGDRPDNTSLSSYASKAKQVTSDLFTGAAVPFVTGCSSIDATAIDAWRRVGVRHFQTMDAENLRYSDPRGVSSLRLEVASYLKAARAVRCDPDDIVIVSGAQQGIDLSIRTVLDRDDQVWIEDPGYLPTRAALAAHGARLVPISIDGEGLVVAQGIEQSPRAKAVYITPSHQYPTGAVMSLNRRMALLEWASRTGAFIIEDDYDSEFRYSGAALPSLQGIDTQGRVIYVGTLSKVLFPGARVGFAVVPPDLRKAFAAARFLIDRQPATLQQQIVAEFMRDGFLTSHIRRMRQRYRASRDLLVNVLTEQLSDIVHIEVPDGGIQLSIFFKDDRDDVATAAAARTEGITVRPLSTLYIAAKPQKGLLLGFSGFEDHMLRQAAIRLGQIIRGMD
jgi:GntR family transcriptional regulator / MocR family aminotransferase